MDEEDVCRARDSCEAGDICRARVLRCERETLV